MTETLGRLKGDEGDDDKAPESPLLLGWGKCSSYVGFVSCFWEGKERSEHSLHLLFSQCFQFKKIILTLKRHTLGEGF